MSKMDGMFMSLVIYVVLYYVWWNFMDKVTGCRSLRLFVVT